MKAKNEAYREIYLDQGDHPVAVKPSSLDDEGPDENENMTEAEKDKEKKTEKKSGTEKMKRPHKTTRITRRKSRRRQRPQIPLIKVGRAAKLS